MKVLFDHNLPHKLRTTLGALFAHQILTASFMQWGHLKNGELLRAAEEAGVDVFVTGDQSLVHEQNLAGVSRGYRAAQLEVADSKGVGAHHFVYT